MCEELVSYARQLAQVTKSCRELCEALQLISGPGDLALCVSLQKACDIYMRFVQQNPPCVAPNYPREWLVKRALPGILHFQDPASLAVATALAAHAALLGGAQDDEAPGVVNTLGQTPVQAAGQVLKPSTVVVTTWWDIAAAGLRGWYATSKITFTTAA